MSDTKFHATRWSLVLDARSDGELGQVALSELCALYYRPVMAFLQREGRGTDTAQDLAHSFFETLLTRGLGEPDPARGRFRNFLLGALKHFLTKQRTHGSAQKRGGDQQRVEWNDLDCETATESLTDIAFDRDWALAVLTAAMTALELQHTKRPEEFQLLRPWLDASNERSQKETAIELGISETAIKVAIHRLRVRWREQVRTAVRATLQDETELDDELRHLLEIMTKPIG